MEDVYLSKAKATEKLMEYLNATEIADREGVESLVYEKMLGGDEVVNISFKGGGLKRVNVTCNSELALTIAVLKELY